MPVNNNKMQTPWDEPSNKLPEPISKRAPSGSLDPNNANPEKMFNYQEEIDEINEQLGEIETAMFLIIDAKLIVSEGQ